MIDKVFVHSIHRTVAGRYIRNETLSFEKQYCWLQIRKLIRVVLKTRLCEETNRSLAGFDEKSPSVSVLRVGEILFHLFDEIRKPGLYLPPQSFVLLDLLFLATRVSESISHVVAGCASSSAN
ncbi:hypothetical protein [Marinobacter manganoxydans]|uniref:hypothetical protein n=1 Tax=Marinobacter manganoxydans TaxID=1150997 RepID=UPI0018726CB3|nr:hypothetical protein [Marinobacter manganoxydans]